MQAQSRAAAADHRQQGPHQGNLFVLRHILLAHADPTTPGDKRATHDVSKRTACLMAVGNKEKWWIGKLHVPTRPNCGLDGSAWASLGMRPARRAQRPASTAARMLFAMVTGSRAFETAVLSMTAEQPSSMASAASDAVPMPASSTTGTGERAQISSMRCGLQMPRPEPIGEPSGITAAAPASASLRQTTGSSVQ